jgi:hypothetical protein
MATPLTFAYVSDWVDYTDPLNIPAQIRVIKAADLLRYENALKDLVQRVNEHDSLVTNNGTAITQLQDRTTSVETVNTAQGTNIAQLTALVNQLQASLNAQTRTTLVRSLTTPYTMVTTNRIHIHTGAAATYTLPAPGTSTDKDFVVHNRGTGNLTLQSAAGNQIYAAGAATATTVLGTSTTNYLVSDGTYWVVAISDTNVTL